MPAGLKTGAAGWPAIRRWQNGRGTEQHLGPYYEHMSTSVKSAEPVRGTGCAWGESPYGAANGSCAPHGGAVCPLAQCLRIELRGRFIIDPDGLIQAMEVLTPPVGRKIAETSS